MRACKKLSFHTQIDAQLKGAKILKGATNSLHARVFFTYQCPRCHSWHLTTKR